MSDVAWSVTHMEKDVGLASRMRDVMALAPEAGAIEFRKKWISWGAMASFMARVEELLESGGLGADVAVGMLLRNRPSHVCAALSVMLSRRCLLTLSPFQSPEALARNIADARPSALVIDAQDWSQEEVRASAVGAMVLVLSDEDGHMSVNLAHGYERPAAAVGRHQLMPGIGVLMLSSGTTGTPKRVPLSFSNYEKAVLGAAFYESGGDGQQLKLKSSVACICLPLVHIGGLWISTLNLSAGRPLVLFEKFSVEGFEDALVRHKPKMVSLPPTAIRMVFDANIPRESLASLIAIRGGSAPLEPAFAQAFEERYGVPILDAYGATEFAGGVAGWTWPDFQKWGKEKRGSVGRANLGVQLQIVDRETGAPLGAGQTGLVEVRAAQLGSSEWVRTTDLGELDEDGFLYIRGRADEAIIRGGFKVLPSTVAEALRTHPAVFDASVVGIPDERLGAIPMAAIELRPNEPIPTEDDLKTFLRRQLVAYQIPARIIVVDQLPRTPSMKISQPAVKALFQRTSGEEHVSA
jgi:long-chain acyl-CoA synthetase